MSEEKQFPDDYADDNIGVALWENYWKEAMEGWPDEYVESVKRQCKAYADYADEEVEA